MIVDFYLYKQKNKKEMICIYIVLCMYLIIIDQ